MLVRDDRLLVVEGADETLIAHSPDTHQRSCDLSHLKSARERRPIELHVQTNLALIRDSLPVSHHKIWLPLGSWRLRYEVTITRGVIDIHNMFATALVQSDLDVRVDPGIHRKQTVPALHALFRENREQ